MIDDEENDEEPQCQSCGSTGVPLTAYTSFRMSRLKGASKILCALCANTKAGNAHEYPEQYPDRDVLQIICYVGNEILKALPKSNGPS